MMSKLTFSMSVFSVMVCSSDWCSSDILLFYVHQIFFWLMLMWISFCLMLLWCSQFKVHILLFVSDVLPFYVHRMFFWLKFIWCSFVQCFFGVFLFLAHLMSFCFMFKGCVSDSCSLLIIAKLRPSPSSSLRWPELSLISNSSPATHPPARESLFLAQQPPWRSLNGNQVNKS